LFIFKDHGVAFTDRHGGVSQGSFASLNLGRSDLDSVADLRSNMAALRTAVGVSQIVSVHQVHGSDVLNVDQTFLNSWGPDAWLGDALPGQNPLVQADALVTTLPGVALLIRVADCVPVVFRDPDAGVIGAAHAGRVGLLSGVLESTVAAMTDLGANPSDMTAWIGPHICGSCYEVPQEMFDQVCAEYPELGATTSWGTPALDLGAGVRRRLADSGIKTISAESCTYTDPNLFSHRGDGALTGRQAGLVWL
jgi:YfiH family protein